MTIREEVDRHISGLVNSETIRLLRALLAERDTLQMAIEEFVAKEHAEAAANLARLMGEG